MNWTPEEYQAHLTRQKVLNKPYQTGLKRLQATNVQPAKTGKHRNRKTVVGAITFDSAKEAKRWQELSLLEQVGAIRDLRRQVSFDLYGANGERVAKYVADFVYHSVEANCLIREDVKSEWTRKLPVYRLKAKLMAAQGQKITEV